MINTGVPRLAHVSDTIFVYYFYQTNTETLNTWRSAIIVYDEEDVPDLVSAAYDDELDNLVKSVIAARQKHQAQDDLRKLNNWTSRASCFAHDAQKGSQT